jgi:hypothetical protein
MSSPRTIQSQYESTCTRCWEPIHIGQTVSYDDVLKAATHPGCELKPRPEPTGELKAALEYLESLNELERDEIEQSIYEQYGRKGFLSDKQVGLILRKAKAAHLPGPDVVPAGKYALPIPEGATKSGARWCFVKVWRSSRDPLNVRCYLLEVGETKLEDGESATQVEPESVLRAIIEFGVANSVRLYGRRRGRCGQCDQPLKVALSRMLDIGPTCGQRFYTAQAWQFEKYTARKILRSVGLDPSADVPPDFDLEALKEANA